MFLTRKHRGQFVFFRLDWQSRSLTGIAIAIGISAAIVPPGLAQDAEVPPPTATPASQPVAAPNDGLYFADIVVRGRPIFQLGSLSGISATDRAEIINRRIASILTKAETLETVTVQTDSARNLATLQLNNRVLMTVTDRDGEDFGLSVDALAQKWAETLNRAIDKPPLAIDVVQRLYGTTRQLMRDTVENLPALIGAILVVFATWLVAKGVRRIAFAWAQRTEGDRSTEILIGRLGYGGVWVLGFVVALGVLGLDIAALLGALGLTSVAIGFSLKDVLSNYISGVILLAARPFKIGDQVVIEDYEGTITQIQLRGTTMKTYDGRVVYIPNQEVFQSSIINNTASTHRRSSVIVGIDYDADIRKAIKAIEKALDRLEEVEFEPPQEVLVRELAASTVNLEVRFWVNSRRRGFLQATSKVTQTIKETLQEAQIEMPTDIYTLAIRNMPTIPVKTVEEQ